MTVSGDTTSVRTIIIICFYLLILWYVIFLAGTIQYRSLKKKTIAMVLKYGQKAVDGQLERSFEVVYAALYPEWCEMIKKTAFFIPDKSELRPILASVENVKKRFIFNPQWVKACLKDHHIDLEQA
jgi:hypothetical protein